MKVRARWVVLAAMALGLMLAAPMVQADSKGGNWGKHKRDDCGQSGHGWFKSSDLEVVGLTDKGKLICFDEDRPDDADKIGKVRGLDGDDSLVGIDYRPATGDLYGVGNSGGVYTIDDGNGRATLVSRLSVALQGTSFGVDFNPAVDRLRIVSDTGQNLRDNVDANGDTLVDGTLTYPGPPAATALGVGAAAYTNNDADVNTATTLFDIDSTMDQTVIQSPANAGLLAATGKLGVDAEAQSGFDIYSTVRDGTTVDVEGYAALSVGGQDGFYEVDLLSGRVSGLGAFEARGNVIGIAIAPNQR